jgi:hypothetical protein
MIRVWTAVYTVGLALLGVAAIIGLAALGVATL